MNLARAEGSGSGDDAALAQLALKRGQRAERKVALEDEPDGLRFVLSDHELALAHLVTERNDAADPNSPALRGRELVADALARNLPLELGEGQQHVEREPPHAGGRVERLGDRD